MRAKIYCHHARNHESDKQIEYNTSTSSSNN